LFQSKVFQRQSLTAKDFFVFRENFSFSQEKQYQQTPSRMAMARFAAFSLLIFSSKELFAKASAKNLSFVSLLKLIKFSQLFSLRFKKSLKKFRLVLSFNVNLIFQNFYKAIVSVQSLKVFKSSFAVIIARSPTRA
jgi:hypothetical protein